MPASSIPLSRSLRGMRQFLRGHLPGQLIVQLTDACNAQCPQCELRAGEGFKRSRLEVDAVKRMIDAAARRGVMALSFTGGEPFLYREALLELIRHASVAGIPYTRTGTNAFFLRDPDKPGWEQRIHTIARALAETELYTLWISLDSAVADVHEEMRGLPGVVRGIERALPIFEQYGIYPSANLGINRNTGGWWREQAPVAPAPEYEQDFCYEIFRPAFDAFYRRAIELGFTIVNCCYPMSVQTSAPGELDNVYGASSADHVVSFTDAEKAGLFRALRDTIPKFEERVRIFTPLSSLEALVRRYAHGEAEAGYPCRGGIDYFFVDARSGDTYPCGFRGEENLGKFHELGPVDDKPFCRACDWECYRDPSELMGPFADLPRALTGRLRREPESRRLWMRDLRYYRACSWFCGREAPDYEKMSRFENKARMPEPNRGGGPAALDREAV